MLYRLLKILFNPTYRVYFKSTHINNAKALPKTGPVILAVNHTSAFMDPILIAVRFERTFHFLARGEAFNSTFSKAIYKRVNMLPIYRPETMPDEVYKNKLIFKKCFDHLKSGKAIMMFPEGFSKTERKIRPIKTGLARMALGAEEENDFNLGVKVVAIGLNYSNPHIFRSDVFINIGDPIDVRSFQSIYEEDPKKGITELTKVIKERMEDCTVVIDDERTDVFVTHVEKLLQYNLEKKQLGLERFEMTKDIASKVESLAVKDQDKFKELELRLSNYVQRLKRLGLKENRVFEGKIKSSLIGNVILLILGFPLFLCGSVLNFIPFKLTGILSRKIQVRDDFVGSLKSVAGMFLFLIYYILISIVFSSFTAWYWAILFFLLLYPLGITALRYVNVYLNLIQDYKHTRLFKRKKTFMDDMKKERQQILNELGI